MDLLARREHSTAELRHKLITRLSRAAGDIDPDAEPEADQLGDGDDENAGVSLAERIEQVLHELTVDGLLSDQRFAEAYVSHCERKGKGPMLVRAELGRRGVSDQHIEHAMNTVQADWTQRAREARQKRFGEAAPEDFNERARQSRFLQSRGFDSQDIRLAMKGKE